MNIGQRSLEPGHDTIPNIHKERFNGIPRFFPSRTKPTTHNIKNTKKSVTNILEPRHNTIPNGFENSLNSIPRSLPVSFEDGNENINNTKNHITNHLEHIGNILEYAREYWCKKVTKSFPCCLKNFGYTREIKTKRIKLFNNSLRKSAKRIFNLVPNRNNLISKLFVVFPQTYKRSS